MSSSYPTVDTELHYLQQRALSQRRRFTRTTTHVAPPSLSTVRGGLTAIPLRFALHAVVALLVPLATLLSSNALPYGLLRPLSTPAELPRWEGSDFTTALAPLGLELGVTESPPPDSAFAAIDALPVPPLNPDLLAVRPVPATIAAEQGIVRNGPGTEYDKVTTLGAGASLRLIARHGDWFQAEAEGGQIVWVAAELLATDQIAAEFLPSPVSIPAPPPPKIGQVTVDGLNLRDGPGTNYIGMTKLPAGAQLDLLARYEDWFQVQTPEGQVGWVSGELLEIGPGVVERIEAVSQIPDPNPALVGVVSQARVNLRGGPGTVYGKIGVLGANTTLELLARHQDWFQVRTPGGVGWVSRELVEVSPYIARRVPQARNIPPAPRAAPRAAQPASSGIRGVQFAPAEATSGPAQFALQFVGARYVWGGASPDRGFDCSGFTRYVYAQFGLNLPHNAAAQYNTSYGVAISNPADLQPGDLVFFVNTYRRGISHVGIYIGGGNVVQALSPGRGVGIANIGSGYWAAHYYGAIRPGR
ncbi:MAG: SH3 domain-containing protein [Chloroflexota bacterium]